MNPQYGRAGLPRRPIVRSKPRFTHLSPQQVRLLDDWGRALRQMFPETIGVVQVGSTLQRPDWRDVDVRIILRDAAYDHLAQGVAPRRLSLPLSMWGQQVTGLPIDCQLQPQRLATAKYSTNQHPRNPLGVRDASGIEGA